MAPISKTDTPASEINHPSSIPSIDSPTTPTQTSPPKCPRHPPRLIVRALYDYTSNRPNVLSFKKGTLIRVITELRSGWWDGRIEEDNTRGWFPRSMVTKVEDEDDNNEGHHAIVRARYDFRSSKPNVLSFEKGTFIRVLTKSGSGWWDGYIEGENKRGWFPRKFVVKVAEYEMERKRLQRLPATLRAVDDYESEHSRLPSFKKGDLIMNAKRLKWGYWEGTLERAEGSERGLFREKFLERVDEDEGHDFMGEELYQDPEDMDWLMRMSRYGTHDTSAAEPMTKVHSQNPETMKEEEAEETKMELDGQREVRNEVSLGGSLDDEWDLCDVSDHEYGGASKVTAEAKRSNAGAVDADFEVHISLAIIDKSGYTSTHVFELGVDMRVLRLSSDKTVSRMP